MAKPVGARCNLACSYCYYLEKGGMYGDGGPGMMTDDLLELFIKQYMACQTQREVLFMWHGGEPLLRPLSFYRRVVALQRKHAGGHLVDNCIQTNGTLLTEEWCRFLKDNNWLVGVSLDGPQWMHDRHRKDNRGDGTFQKVMRGVELLDRHGVEWNAMAVSTATMPTIRVSSIASSATSDAVSSSSRPSWSVPAPLCRRLCMPCLQTARWR